jgi:L-ornithine N5-oxygenase
MNEVHDFIGVGVGPAHLALAIALHERSENLGRALSVRFLERKGAFSWHPEMLIPGATVQVSFLKDLVTLRNPRSEFSFLNYLRNHGRLEHFVNLKEWYPSRLEFSSYFAWVAKCFANDLHYEHKVTKLAVAMRAGQPVFQLSADVGERGKQRVFYARNISLACGGTPHIPAYALTHIDGKAACHASKYLSSIAHLRHKQEHPYVFTVVGRGQSSVEIVTNLLETFPNATVHVVIHGHSFMAVDDNPFLNEVFFCDTVDTFTSASSASRARLHEECKRTNYSVADADLLQHLYKLMYVDRVGGRERLLLHRRSPIIGFESDQTSSCVMISDAQGGEAKRLRSDLTIFATGYQRTEASALLSGIANHLQRNPDESLQVDRFYRVETRDLGQLQLFIQGETEEFHGISNSLLSILPFRSAEIAQLIGDSSVLSAQRGHHAAA